MQTRSDASPARRRAVGSSKLGLAIAVLGCALFLAGWVLAFSGIGVYLLLPGLVISAFGGWLARGLSGALAALLLTVLVVVVLLVAVTGTAAAWREFRDSDVPGVQTPSPKR